MGAVLAKFRKEKTTYEILENLEQEIKELEEYTLSTQIQQKRYVGNFLLISIGLYIIGFLIFYFVFFPPTWMERITYSVPLLIFPMLIFFLKRLVAWYFQRKLNKNSTKLKSLRTEKRKIIEKVMDKETYKVAIEILNRFGDKTNGIKSQGGLTPITVEHKAITPIKPQQQPITPRMMHTTQMVGPLRPPIPNADAKQWPLNASPRAMIPPTTPLSAGYKPVMSPSPNFPMRRRIPFPIINQHSKGVMEKMVDYLVGDGPHNRFAMICKQCYSHNGMAFLAEYEFTPFRCAFCGTLNPPKKVRPVAPPLSSGTPSKSLESTKSTDVDASSSTSSSEKYSGSETDEEKTTKDAIEDVKSETPEEELQALVDSVSDTNVEEFTQEDGVSRLEESDEIDRTDIVPEKNIEKDEEDKKNN